MPTSSSPVAFYPSPFPTLEIPSAPEPSISPPPQTAAGRTRHAATLLADGRVLITGGQGGAKILASAVLYDPKTGRFAATGSMATPRRDQTATLLPGGRVLIAGGYDGKDLLRSAELYDPKTGTFTTTGQMTVTRAYQVATLLPSGLVLLVGGDGFSYDRLSSAELYDPKTGKFTGTGTMTVTQEVDTATLLANGSVLVTGSWFDQSGQPVTRASAELYDPKTGKFSLAGSMSVVRTDGTATLLVDGKVLVAGGNDPSGFPLSSAELYDPSTNSFSLLHMTVPRAVFTATRLPDGRVLLAGGDSGTIQEGFEIGTSSAEIYDPGTGLFTLTGSMTIRRRNQTATLLSSGRVLIVGGEDDIRGIGLLDPTSTSDLSSLSSNELYAPTTGTFSATASLTDTP
ncbi:MAG: kelch repeat-containing protein [Candidatus Limnocylindrales bacterium]